MQKMLEGHLPRVIYHQVYWYTKIKVWDGLQAKSANWGLSRPGGVRFGLSRSTLRPHVAQIWACPPKLLGVPKTSYFTVCLV